MKKRILIVDDDKDIRDTIADFFEQEGWNPTKAYDGKNGLALVEQEIFDVIVTDVAMPRMNGFDFLCEVRTSRQNRRSIVIVISGAYDEEQVRLMTGLKLSFFMPKPILYEQLLYKVNESLKIKESLGSHWEEYQFEPSSEDTFDYLEEGA